MRVRLKINSVDYSTALLEREWNIVQTAFGVLDTASWSLDDPGSTISLTRGHQVVIENYADATERYFGGVLTEVVGQTHGVGRRWDCKANDWTFILDRTLVTAIYRGKVDSTIINDTASSPKGLFRLTGSASDTYAEVLDFDISTYVVNGIANTQYLKFNNTSIRDALDAIAEFSGRIWYVDPFQKVHYQAFDDIPNSTFALSDNPGNSTTVFPYFGLKQTFNFSQIVNEVVVTGGTIEEESSDVPANLGDKYLSNANGSRATNTQWFWIAPSGQSRIQVYTNTNSDSSAAAIWTAKTVGLAGHDSATGFDVLWDPSVRTLYWNTAPPNFSYSYKIDGNRLRPLISRVRNPDSVAAVGRVYSYSIKDITLTNDRAVEYRANAELQKRSGELQKVTLRHNQDGAQAGELIHVVNATLGISTDYLIEKLTTRLLGGTVASYDMQLKPKSSIIQPI